MAANVMVYLAKSIPALTETVYIHHGLDQFALPGLILLVGPEFSYCKMQKNQGIDLISHCHIRIGNGLSTRFWSDIWLGDTQLRAKFPRIYALDLYKDCTVADKMAHSLEFNLRRPVRGGVESQQFNQLSELLGSVILSNSLDRWRWDLNGSGEFHVKDVHRWRWDLNGSGEFHVKDVRNLLDDLFLPKDDSATRWSKYVPIKINVFAWRVALDHLPTRTNLLQRGVSVEDLLCPTCHSTQEDLSHVLFSYEVAAAVIRLVCQWWNVDRDYFSSYLDWVSWFKDIRMQSKIKSVLEDVFFSTWWSLWNF
uniref:Reverse transcriptase zinc-binding domain-containing protein n=1 Tax=Tanacetum cinerariifolium TaxID=118510 RepID=A0A699I8B4_TANCI|nr:hypothetical protein [Tanacetum cinerariifolium]